MKILTGKFAKGAETVTFHVGANADQRMTANIGNMTAAAMGVNMQSVGISSADSANKAIGVVDTALTQVSRQRADLGAYQNRMEQTVQGISVAAENMQAAESRIRDVDMASEMVDYVKNQILVRSGTSMLAQANLKPQTILELLR
jgi:flagellin